MMSAAEEVHSAAGDGGRRGSDSSEDSWCSGVSPVFDASSDHTDWDDGTGIAQSPLSLIELSCQVLGADWSFEEVTQRAMAPLPDDIQLMVAKAAFPSSESKIRMYVSLSNPSPHVFSEAEQLLRKHKLKGMYQIGFQLCARFSQSSRLRQRVSVQTSVSFDRGCITSCSCTCHTLTPWCSHVVAVCLAHVRDPGSTQVRPTLSTSLLQMDALQLRKLIQYLISSLPEQSIFPTQEIMDELLQAQSNINLEAGAPDVTAGGISGEQAKWLLDPAALEETLQQQLVSLQKSFTSGLSENEPVRAFGAYDIFQRMLTTSNYKEDCSFHVNYISVIMSFLRGGDTNALSVAWISSRVLGQWIAKAEGGNTILEALACAMVHELANVWMLVAFSLPCGHVLGPEVVCALSEFVHLLSNSDKTMSSNTKLLLVGAVSFACERFTLKTKRDCTIPRSSGAFDHLFSVLEKFGSILPLALVKSLSMQVLVSVLTALLVYLRTQDSFSRPPGSARMIAEAAVECFFVQNKLSKKEDAPLCLVDSEVTVTGNSFLALLQLGLEVLSSLQRDALAVGCALKVLSSWRDQDDTSPGFELLLMRYEKRILTEIDTWLSEQTTPVQEEPLLSLARDIANSLTRSSPDSCEGGHPLPPFCLAEALFSLLTHRRRQDDHLLKLGQSMVLHILRKYPITGPACSPSSRTASDAVSRNELIRLCNWERMETLLLKALELSNVYVHKDITSALESGFLGPLSSLENSFAGSEGSCSGDWGPSEEEGLGSGLDGVSMGIADVKKLQKVVENLSWKKKGRGIEKLAPLELYVLSLRVKRCLDLSHGDVKPGGFNTISKVSALIAEVGEAGLQLLYHRWPACFAPADVVRLAEELSTFDPKPFSSAALCQVLKSVLHTAGSMEPSSTQAAVEICCAAGPKHALEASEILTQLCHVKASVFFFVAEKLYDIHLALKTKECEREAMRARVTSNSGVPSENWEEESAEVSNAPAANLCPPDSLLGPPPKLLEHPHDLHPARIQGCLATLSPMVNYNLAVASACLPSKRPQPRLSHNLLQQTFSVGMKALEALRKEQRETLASTDEDNFKPVCASGVKIVTITACSLGNLQIMKLIEDVKSAVTSPHVLKETALAIARHLSLEHPHQATIHLCREPLLGLMRRTIDQYASYIKLKCHQLESSRYQNPAVLLKLINCMKQSMQYVPDGEDKLKEMFASLSHHVRDKRLKQVLAKNHPEYMVPCKSESRRARQMEASNAYRQSSPFELEVSEYWDD